MKVLGEFQTTVRKALTEIDPHWESYPGLIICGTHTPQDWENLISEVKQARETGLPFLGICFGHQIAAIEYARNALGIHDATSEEFGVRGTKVVYKLPNLKVGQYRINRHRLDSPYESYWNNYEVLDGIIELWKKADNFITCQYHPEYQSSVDDPHQLLVEFINYAKKYE